MRRAESMVFALDGETRVIRHVRELESTGRDCGCICLGCSQPLEAVNATATVYKPRPHFRHIVGTDREECGAKAIAKAIELAMAEAETSILLPPVPPGLEVPYGLPEEGGEISIERFALLDSGDAHVVLPGGRELKVCLRTHGPQDPGEEPAADLEICIPDELLDELEELSDLRRFLTLDRTAWRWRESRSGQVLDEPGGLEPDQDDDLDSPGSDSDEPFEPEPATRMPVEMPEIRIQTERGGPVTILRRTRWPSGVMTEVVLRYESGRSAELFEASKN